MYKSAQAAVHMTRDEHQQNSKQPSQAVTGECTCSLRRLLEASSDAKEDVAAALQHTSDGFAPGLPGLTKLVSLFTKQGKWRKALAIYDVLGCLGLQPDLVICNAALGALPSCLGWPAKIAGSGGPDRLHACALALVLQRAPPMLLHQKVVSGRVAWMSAVVVFHAVV